MDKSFDILVTLSTFAEYSDKPLRLLEESGFTFFVHDSGKRMDPDEIVKVGKNCKGLIAGVEKYSSDTLNEMPDLKCISRVGVGIDSIDLDECKRRGIAVLNTPDEPVLAVAELTLAMILGLLRQLPKVNALTCAGKWQRVPGNLLSGKRVGLIGLGRIGQKVAKMVQAFNAKVIAADPYADGEWARKNNVKSLGLQDLLREADIISIHASATESKLFIGRKEISMMKNGGWIINMARGDMLDDAALSEALRSGRLAGAGLDVFPQEPYSGALRECDNVILTPHQATLNYETRVDMETHAADNIVKYLQNTSRNK